MICLEAREINPGVIESGGTMMSLCRRKPGSELAF